MKSYKDIVQQIDEVLTKSTPAGEWIHDFVHSDNPKFAGKSAAKRKQMALAAYYAKKNESAAVSQNSTAEVDMREAKEEHFVHVSDGSKYDETPHDKDVEHVKKGAMIHGGKWAGHSDKGAFFKFGSKDDAERFKHHVDKCPHRSCYADLTEAVEYKGIGTDVVDKKKKLNPTTPLTMKPKQVKDFKEEAEQIDELSKDTVQSYKDKIQPDVKRAYAIHQDPWKKTSKDDMHKLRNRVKGDERADMRLKEDQEEDDRRAAEHHQQELERQEQEKTQGDKEHIAFTKFMAARRLKQAEKSGKKMSQAWYNKQVAKKNIKEEQIDEISKKTLGSYISKAEKEEDKYQQNYTKLRNTRDITHGKFSDDTPHMADLDRKAGNRGSGVYLAKQKLAKEAYEHGPIDRDAKVAIGHKAAVLAGSGLDSGKHGTIVGSSKERTGDHWHIKTASGEIVKMHKHRVAKLKEEVLDEAGKVYDPITKKMVARKPIKVQAGGGATRNGVPVETGPSKYKEKLKETFSEKVLNEISKSTLLRYIPSAARDVGSHTYAGKEAGDWAAHYTRSGEHQNAERQLKNSKKSFDKANKRIKGIDRATRSLAYKEIKKEEVQVDEAIANPLPVQHAVAAVHRTLGPNSATRFLSHLKPGTEKHTTWDKVNDALVKQGVHTRHIARIAQHASHMNEEVELDESRGHKVLATFFKNREVAQKAFTGQNKPAETPKEPEKKEVKKESVNPALMAILKKRQAAYDAAKKAKEENKKKVAESRTPAVHAADPKKTKTTAKVHKHASIPGSARLFRGLPDSNEPGNEIKEDMYTSEYKIKYYVDPITGENKTRKIRPHKVNFKASKMRGEPAQKDAQGDYGMKESVKEGFDDYHAIAKELVKRHGKNVDTGHIQDIEGERDSHRPLDRSEVMHHVNKILNSKTVKEDDMPKDEKWTEYKGKTFKKD